MENSCLATHEPGNASFQFEVNGLGSAKESYRSHTIAPLIQTAMGSGFYARMIRETEIVVGREHHYVVTLHSHLAPLFTLQWDFILEGLRLFDAFQLA